MSDVEHTPQTPRRFRIRSVHRQGGLGRVFHGHDKELDREVAIKEIRPDYVHSSEARGRFLREARITGQLEHPGVVPVYGMGRYADGMPYYAMRFVRGQTLKDAIHQYGIRGTSITAQPGQDGEESYSMTRLVTCFREVCMTVAYAHSHDIIHRDIKPSNVILGPFGETLLLDWGLAKRLDDDEPEDQVSLAHELNPLGLEVGADAVESTETIVRTQSGATLGTLAFMSPEQACGRSHIDKRTDVYSLGATLYVVLTGRVPFPETETDPNRVDEIKKQIQAGQFPRPQQVTRVDSQLEAICLRAMQTDPHDRYQSAKDLAHDIDRWIDGEPVVARPERWNEWTRRQARLHFRAILALSMLILVAAVLGTFLTVALSEGRSAARRTDESREVIREIASLLNSSEIRGRPKEKLRAALEQHYDSVFTGFAHDIDDLDVRSRRALADAAFWLARIQNLENNPADAIPTYGKSLDTLNALEKSRSDSENYQGQIAELEHDLAVLYHQIRDYDRSDQSFQRSLNIREQDTSSRTYFADLGRGYGWWGDQQWERARFDKALRSYLRSLTNRRKASRENSDAPVDCLQLARGHANFAKIYAAAEQNDESRRIYVMALEILDTVSDEDADLDRLYNADLLPGDFRGDRARRRLNIAWTFFAEEDYAASVEYARTATQIYADLASRNPQVRRFKLGLARAQTQLAMALYRGQIKDSTIDSSPEEVLVSAVDGFQKLMHGDQPQLDRDHIWALANLGQMEVNAGDSRGFGRLKQALELTQNCPDEPLFLGVAVETLHICAAAWKHSDRPRGATFARQAEELESKRKRLVSSVRAAIKAHRTELTREFPDGDK